MAYGSGVFVDDSTYLRGLWLVGIVSNEDNPHRRDRRRVKSLDALSSQSPKIQRCVPAILAGNILSMQEDFAANGHPEHA